MIQNRNLLSTIAIFGALTFSGCTLSKMVKMSKNQQLTVTPSPLEVHADEVKFNMSAVLPVKMLKKKTTYTANTTYKYGEKKVEVGNIEFNATEFPNAKKEQPKLAKDFSFAYADDMQRGELVVQGVAAKGKKSKTTPEMPVALGIITTSKLVKEIPAVAYAETGYNNQPEFEPTDVNFYFSQGSAALRQSETSSKRGKFLNAFIAEKNVTKTVTVTGTHSPEGRETKNAQLSEQRAAAIEKFYRNKMKVYNYKKQADSVEFVLKPVIQDWTMFKDSLNANATIPQDQKDQILAIVDGGTGDFVQKEMELQKLPAYKTVFKQVYPKLRTAQTEILTLVEKKPDAEISMLAKKIAEGSESADKLNDKELAYAATLTPDLNEKKAIYEAAVKKNDRWQAHNDLGAIYLDMAKKETDSTKIKDLAGQAITHLEMAKTKQETAEVYVNLATAYSMQGNKAQAQEAVNKATTLTGGEEVTKTINALKGVLEIKAAKYNEAVSSLSQAGQSPEVLYNKGLAQVLAKQYDAALPTLTESAAASTTDNDAWAHYVSAIAAARAKNESTMLTELTQAIAADSNLRAKALQDLEFYSYANSEGFKNAIK